MVVCNVVQCDDVSCWHDRMAGWWQYKGAGCTVVLLGGVRMFECYSTVWSVLPVVLPG